MLNKIINLPFIKSLLINVILIIPVLCLFNISFDTRDDIGMMFLAKGVVISDIGTGLILFSSPILGSFLKFGFNLFPGINFYTFFYLFCFILSHVLLLNALILINIKRYPILIYISFFIIFSIKILLNLQFTVISTLLVLVALVYFYMFLENNKTINIIISLFFFSLGMVIRPEMALMILLFTIPFFFFYCKRQRKLRRLLFFLSVGCISYIVDQKITLSLYEKSHYNYRNPQLFMATYFTDYRLYNKLPKYRQNEIKYKYNWTDNDIEFFNYFCLKETAYFDKKKLSDNDVLNDYLIYSQQITLKSFALFLVPLMKFDYFIFVFVCIFFLLHIGSFRINHNPFLFGTLASVSLVLVYYYVSHVFLKKSPERIVMSFSLVTFIMILITSLHSEFDLCYLKYKNWLIFIVIIFVSISLNKSIEKSKNNSHEAHKFYSNLEKLNKNYTYFNFTSGLNFQDIKPFDNLKRLIGLNVYFPSSGADHPAVLSKYPEIKKYDYQALLQKNHFILADSQASINVIERLLRIHFKEKYNLPVKSTIQKIGSLYFLKMEKNKIAN